MSIVNVSPGDVDVAGVACESLVLNVAVYVPSASGLVTESCWSGSVPLRPLTESTTVPLIKSWSVSGPDAAGMVPKLRPPALNSNVGVWSLV